MLKENIKYIKQEADKNFNYRKDNKRQIIIASTLSDRKKVLYTNNPFRKLEIINPLLEKDIKRYDRRIEKRRISEHNSKI